jgi:Methyltransferase domain
MSVIDLGGTASAWMHTPIRPKSVHIVNLERPPTDLPSWLRVEVADACDLPAAIRTGSYDLVFSNSVIEHVGGHAQRQRFAATVHELADRHWVQTPYRYFPVEPHWLFPAGQFLPVKARATVVRRWPLVHTPNIDRDRALREALGVELLSITDLKYYFPDSQIRHDRLAGLVKSLIAVKR